MKKILAKAILVLSMVSSLNAYQTKDAYGNYVDSNDDYQNKDAYGNYVDSCD